MSDERRATERAKIRLNKIIRADVELDGATFPCYLYIVDIGLTAEREGGMKLTSDFVFPSDRNFRVRLVLEDPLEAWARVVWQRDLEGGTHVYGMQFVDMTEAESAAARRFLERYSVEYQRKVFKLNRVITIEFTQGDAVTRAYALAMDLSSAGLKIANDFGFDVVTVVGSRLFLDLDRPPVEVRMLVREAKKSALDRFIIDFEFVDVSEETRSRIDEYLDRARTGTVDRQTVRETMDPDRDADQPTVAS